jgi:hypothetical protein
MDASSTGGSNGTSQYRVLGILLDIQDGNALIGSQWGNEFTLTDSQSGPCNAGDILVGGIDGQVAVPTPGALGNNDWSAGTARNAAAVGERVMIDYAVPWVGYWQAPYPPSLRDAVDRIAEFVSSNGTNPIPPV